MEKITIIILAAIMGAYAGIGAICGTVHEKVSDSPLEGALVVLAGGKFDIMYRDSAHSDAEGTFCFDSLPAGADFSLYVLKDGFFPDSEYPVFSRRDSVVMKHFRLSAVEYISGTVIDEQSRAPLVGAVVCTGDLLDTTDGGGKFSLPISSDLLKLRVRKPGYLTTAYAVQEDEEELKLELPPIPEGISDLPHMEILVSDFALDNPISGAEVDVKLVKTQKDSDLDTQLTTGPDGLVRLTGLPYVQEQWASRCFRFSGEGYLIHVSVEGYRDRRIGPFRVFENEIYRLNVPVKKEVVLHTRVLDTEGKPVYGAGLARFELGQVHYSTTDENGWSAWSGFLPGEYDITVVAVGMETRVVKCVVSGEDFSDTQTVTLQPFEQGKTLSGHLVSENDEPFEAGMPQHVDSVVTFTADLPQSRLTLVTFRDSTAFRFNGIPQEVDSGFLNFEGAEMQKIFLEDSATYTELRFYPPTIDTKRNPASSGDRLKPYLSGTVLHLGGSSSRRYIVKLFDMRGRLVYRQNVTKSTGILDFSKVVTELNGFFACSVTDEKLCRQSFPLLMKN